MTDDLQSAAPAAGNQSGSLPKVERIAVVVVTYNSASLLPAFVGSLEPGLAGSEWQLLVVDNDSQDETPHVARKVCPGAVIVEMGRNAGYAAGINAGVRAAAPHSAILALNPDVRLRAGCVTELLRALREPGVGIAVPRLVDGRGDLIASIRREPTLRRAAADLVLGATRAGRIGRLGEVVTDPAHYAHETTIDWAEGSTQLISAECWRDCGPWDESFFLYSEETEFNLRARDAGYTTRYVPTAHAVHLEGGSGSSPWQHALLVANRVRLFRRRRGMTAGAIFWLVNVLREGTRAALGRPANGAAFRTLVNPRRLRRSPSPDFIVDKARRVAATRRR